MHDYASYLEHLESALEPLPPGHRAAFAACCAERFVWEYEHFVECEGWGDAVVVRRCLDEAWRVLAGGAYDGPSAAAMIRQCEAAVPREEDFPASQGARNAVRTVVAALECLESAEPENAIEAAGFCLQTLIFEIEGAGQAEGVDSAREGTTWNDPDMQREITQQLADIEQLSKLHTLDQESVDLLKASSVANRDFWVPSWRDSVVEWALIIALWPVLLGGFVWVWLRTRIYVWRPIDSAWAKCLERWEPGGQVMMQAGHVGPEFCHTLAIALGKAHRKSADFFAQKLHHSNPLWVGYAFKCLIRAKPRLQLEDIPADVLQRTDEISLRWADLGYSEPVGEFIRGYFLEQDAKQAASPRGGRKCVPPQD